MVSNKKSVAVSGIDISPILEHVAIKEATEVYIRHNRSIQAVKDWFLGRFKKDFEYAALERYFTEYVDPTLDNYLMIREGKIEDVRTKINDKEKNFPAPQIVKEIIFDFIKDVYASKPIGKLVTREQWTDFQRISKTLTDLAKSYKEYYQMEFDILGFGKTEEEQKKLMLNYVKGLLGQVTEAFDDMPEAKERLEKIIKVSLSQDSSDED